MEGRTDKDMDTALNTFTRLFEGKRLTTILYQGKLWCIAREVGMVMGYGTEGKSFVDLINREWAVEFDDEDRWLVQGDDLRAIKQMLGELLAKEVGVYYTPTLLLLSESGIYKATLLSHKPEGRRLRSWLAKEVLPGIRATGGYVASATPAPTAPVLDRAMIEQIVLIVRAVLRETSEQQAPPVLPPPPPPAPAPPPRSPPPVPEQPAGAQPEPALPAEYVALWRAVCKHPAVGTAKLVMLLGCTEEDVHTRAAVLRQAGWLVRKGYGYYSQVPPSAKAAPPGAPPSASALDVPPELLQSPGRRVPGGWAKRMGRGHALAYTLIRNHQGSSGAGWRTTIREIAESWPGGAVTHRYALLVTSELVDAGWVEREDLGEALRLRAVAAADRKTQPM